MWKEGWLFALDREEAKQLFAATRQQKLEEFVQGLHARGGANDERMQPCGAAWDPLHRCLSDGTVNPAGGEPPLNQCILGGRPLIRSDERVAVLVRPDIVPLVSEALEPLTRDWLEQRFDAIDSADDPPHRCASVDQVWACFEQIRHFYRRAAAGGRAVMFAAGG